MHQAFCQRHPTKRIYPALRAAEGLELLGYEVRWFDLEEAGELPKDPEVLVVGHIEVVRGQVERIRGSKPPVLNYPEALQPFALRSLKLDKLGAIRNDPTRWPVFMKPASDIKTFGGRLVRGVRDLVATRDLDDETPVWASEPVRFRSEYRCFVMRGEVLGCRPYKGETLTFPHGGTVRHMVDTWKDSPKAYCLDVGVADLPVAGHASTLLVEVNDAYSAGDYGLDSVMYGRFLETRWCEMTGATPIP